MLQFPHFTTCLALKDHVDVSYKYVIEKQPIGKALFKQYCEETSPELCRCWMFLELIEEYEMNDDDECKRRSCATDICSRLESQQAAAVAAQTNNIGEENNVDPSSSENDNTAVDGHAGNDEGVDNDCCYKDFQKMTEEFIQKSIELAKKAEESEHPELGIFSSISNELREFLADEPFKKFTDTMYFHRYLQWKYIEGRPIDKHTFRVYRTLGKGGFGEVCACQSRVSGKMYALKKLEKKRVKKRHAESLTLNEKTILERVNSPFIVSLAYAFETKDALCLVLTLLNGGDLKFHLYTLCPGGFDERRVQFYASEITLGLQHLHREKIVYRDLKPENILLDDDGHCRISDLGLAVELKDNKPISGRVGTVGYMAPEVVRNDRYSYGVDWWALGCLIYEMIDGRAPFRQRKEKVKREEVERRVVQDHEKYNEKFSDAARTLCRALLQKDAKLRMGSRHFTAPHEGAFEIKMHAFFTQPDQKTGREPVPWRKMESGKIKPPFIPDPNSVYAKDVLDIEQFSTVKGVKLDTKDQNFYRKFNSGSVSIPFQTEMLETKIFYDMNIFMVEDGLARDLRSLDAAAWTRRESKFDFIMNLFRRKNRSRSEVNGSNASASDTYFPANSTPLGSTKCPRCRLNNLRCKCPNFKSVHDLRSPSLITGQEQAKNDRPSTSREKSKSINDEGERSSSSDVPRTPLKTSASTACHNNKKDDGVDSAPPVIENNGHLNNHLSPAAVMQQTTHLSNPPIAVVPS